MEIAFWSILLSSTIFSVIFSLATKKHVPVVCVYPLFLAVLKRSLALAMMEWSTETKDPGMWNFLCC